MLKERKLTVRTAAESPVKVIMKELNTSLRGLDPETVMVLLIELLLLPLVHQSVGTDLAQVGQAYIFFQAAQRDDALPAPIL